MTKRTINQLSVDPNTDQKRKKMCKTQYEVSLQKYIVETLGCDYKGLTGFIHFSNSKYRRFKIYFEQMLRFEIEYEAEEDIEFREFRSFKDAVDFFLVGKEVKDRYQKIYEQAKKNISAGLDKLHTSFLNDEETYVLVKKLQTKRQQRLVKLKQDFDMFVQSEKMLHAPELKDIYETMKKKETQMVWLRYQLMDKIFSNETRDVIKMVQEKWKRMYRRRFEEFNIPNFIDRLTTEELQTFYNEIKNDYYLETEVWGYDAERYKDKFKCEPLTNPTYEEHEKKLSEAFNKRNEWIRIKDYLEYSMSHKKSPFEIFTDAYDEWLQQRKYNSKTRGVPPSRIGSKRYQLTPKEGEARIKMFVSFPNESIDTECEIPGSRRRTPEELKRVLEDVRRRREKLNAK